MHCRPKSLLAALALLCACGGVRPTPEDASLPPGRDASAWDAPDASAPPGPDAGPADPPPAGAVRVATFNTHLFFDTICDSYRGCGAGEFEAQPTLAEFNARADQIATGLRALAPTAVLLQEIEKQYCLDALVTRLADVLPNAVLGETWFDGSVDVAVMSALPILEVRKHRDQVLYRPDGTQTSFARELLEVHLDDGGRRVIVFAAHFKSKSSPDDPGRRIAEAQASAQIVAASAAEFPQALIVFGGDLNDTPGSPTLLALEAAGDLSRVAQELGALDGTYTFNGVSSALDHLYLDLPAAGSYVTGSARVVRDPGARGYAGSDHAALVADFVLE